MPDLYKQNGINSINGRKISILSKLRKEDKIILFINIDCTGASQGNPRPLFKRKIVTNTIKPNIMLVFLYLLFLKTKKLPSSNANKEKVNAKKKRRLI
ncbi:MAG: hypothetical protein M1365_00545 [Actinobacteria bacterium]|nr:hypothetical protein [Actinomycetota bacterium]